jgi:uncharacterized protein (DUF58 family)
MPESPVTQYLKPEVIRGISRLDLQARCIVEGFLAGLHRSPFHGFSTEFSEHREYAAGDDPKYIDWNVYNKTERLYIKKYEAQTNLECTLFVDVSKSMAYSGDDRRPSKLEYAIYLAAAISYLLMQQQDAVGLITADDDLRAYLRPRSKRSQLAAAERATAVADCLGKAAALIRHRGMVIIFSDLLDDLDATIAALQRLAFAGHDIVVFHVLDPAERELSYDGHMLFVDSEEPALAWPAVGEQIRASYRREIAAFIETLRTRCSEMKIHYVALDTGQQFDVALTEFLMGRRAYC